MCEGFGYDVDDIVVSDDFHNLFDNGFYWILMISHCLKLIMMLRQTSKENHNSSSLLMLQLLSQQKKKDENLEFNTLLHIFLNFIAMKAEKKIENFSLSLTQFISLCHISSLSFRRYVHIANRKIIGEKEREKRYR